jgi:hypothetical protein
MDPVRKQICQRCPSFRRGEVHAETWCARFDDQPNDPRNCEAARHARWRIRLTSEYLHCRQWLNATVCPVCTIPDALEAANPLPVDGDYDRWRVQPDVCDRHISALRAALARHYEPPAGLAGDGVVYVGEGGYWPMLVAAVRMLRRFNRTIPVQVWHRSPVGSELDDDPCTTLVDAGCFSERHRVRKCDHWAAKNFAIAHSGFRRVLYLDADAYAVNDPAPLFPILDECAFAYWANLPWYGNYFDYEMFLDRLQVPRDRFPPTVQGGHYLLDVEKAWPALMVALHLNNHADFWWWRQVGGGRTTDEDSWRIAIGMLGTSYRMIHASEWHSGGGAFVCSYDGRPYAIHRCQAKAWRGQRVWSNPSLPNEAEFLATFYGLYPVDASHQAETFQQRKDRVRTERCRLFAAR